MFEDGAVEFDQAKPQWVAVGQLGVARPAFFLAAVATYIPLEESSGGSHRSFAYLRELHPRHWERSWLPEDKYTQIACVLIILKEWTIPHHIR